MSRKRNQNRRSRAKPKFSGPIPQGFSPYPNGPGYYVNEGGVVASTRRQVWTILKGSTTQYGYQAITVAQGSADKQKFRFIHVIVAETFLGPGNGRDVNHINGNKQDNRLSNLEWATRQENAQHAVDTGLRVYVTGKGHKSNKYTDDQVNNVRALYLQGRSYPEVVKLSGINKSAVYRMIMNTTYFNEEYGERLRGRHVA